MKPLKAVFESGQTILWIETQNTVAFLRPVPDTLLWTPGPTAGLTQPLRLREIRFTPSEGLPGAFAIFDVGHDPIPLDDVSISISERHSAVQMPAILPIRAAEAHLIFVRPAGNKCLHPFSCMSVKIVRVNYRLPP